MRLLKAAFAAVLFVLLLPVAAFAQETVVAVGDVLNPWLTLLLAFAGVVVPALGTWAAAELRRRTGIVIQQAHMNTLQTALLNGAGLLKVKAVQMANNVTIDARHPAIREAILYVNNSAPDAIAYFGLTPESLAEKLIAKLGLINPEPGQTTVVNNATLTTGAPPA